jgi:hypothetical protein
MPAVSRIALAYCIHLGHDQRRRNSIRRANVPGQNAASSVTERTIASRRPAIRSKRYGVAAAAVRLRTSSRTNMASATPDQRPSPLGLPLATVPIGMMSVNVAWRRNLEST